MKPLAFLFKKILYPACVFFAITWFILCFILDNVMELVNVNLGSSLLCFFIGIAIASCNLILTNRRLPFVARFFAHMGLSIVSISLLVAIFDLILKTGYAFTGKSFYLVLLLVLVYVVVATPALLVYNHFFLSRKEKVTSSSKKSKSQPEYSSMFKKS